MVGQGKVAGSNPARYFEILMSREKIGAEGMGDRQRSRRMINTIMQGQPTLATTF